MVVVDTHAWLWWQWGDRRLSVRAGAALDAASEVGVPAICCWEVVLLADRGRIELDRRSLEWLELALSDHATRLLPLTPAIAARAVGFGKAVPPDPAGRLILATAVEHGAPLVTCDGPITASGLAETIW